VQYLNNRLSDLRQTQDSGPDFCKDDDRRDDANRSEHFLHTFCTLFRNLYSAIDQAKNWMRDISGTISPICAKFQIQDPILVSKMIEEFMQLDSSTFCTLFAHFFAILPYVLKLF